MCVLPMFDLESACMMFDSFQGTLTWVILFHRLDTMRGQNV